MLMLFFFFLLLLFFFCLFVTRERPLIILELHRTQVGKCISTLRLTSLNINVKGLKRPEVNFNQCYFPLILSKGPQAFR